MVWMVEKKIFYHILHLGYERVTIPLKVRFEFEVQGGKLVDKSLNWQQAIAKMELLNRKKVGGRRDWHLPSINALESLVYCGRYIPALPDKHPFA